MTAETRTTIRLAPDVLSRVKEMAKREHRSTHAQLLVLIERGIRAEEEDQKGTRSR
jgi:predicted transcriptional regulator